MKSDIKVPSMGESISEATIGQIIASNGTRVKADAEILELETDKLNQVLYAPQAGIVHLTVKSGDGVKIGQIIGTIESIEEEKGRGEEAIEEEKKQADKPEVKPFVSSPDPVASSPVKPVEGKISEKDQQAQALRYTRDDFLNDLMLEQPESTSAKAKEKEIESKQSLSQRETRRPMSKIRKVIAQRLVEAQRTTAMLTTFNEADLTQIIQLREKYKESFAKKYGSKLGFMSFFVKATVSALQAFPNLNSYLDGDDIVHRKSFDIGVAVGTDRGVIVPIIRNCDQLNFARIEQAIDQYAKKAREGTLVAGDLQGGGFTITNGGVYGSLLSTPILLPPQCGILGMHKIEKRPIVVDDQVVIRSMMYLALSYDHRLIDGKEAVSFLIHIKNNLEDPLRLLLDI